MNAICLCSHCHRFFWHDNPKDAVEWFDMTFPERRVYLEEAKKIFVKRNDEYFQKVAKALKEHELTSLMIYNPNVDNSTNIS